MTQQRSNNCNSMDLPTYDMYCTYLYAVLLVDTNRLM